MLQVINNRYKVLRLLGEGGFGKTFLTEDTHLPSHRRCVVKLLKPQNINPDIYKLIQDRFQREAAILEQLGTENNRIPTLYAYFSEQDQFYLVQEYVEGQTLTQMVSSSGPMSEAEVTSILRSLLYVLNFVHGKQIVHRDIKPDNIIIRSSDRTPVLIDFGAVRESMGTVMNSQGRAVSSIVIGTPGFMPAEQAAGRPAYSSDLYSLGLTMVFLLTGRMPEELQTDHRTGKIFWHQYASHVSSGLKAVLDKAIAPYQGDRFSTAKEMLDGLQPSRPMPVTPPVQYVQQEEPPPTLIPSGNNNQNNYQQPANNPYQQTPGYQNIQPLFNPVEQPSVLGGGGTFNTSAPVPQEIKGWNWGAFLLAPFWTFPNQVWVGLISFIPFVGIIMGIILGAKGNTWAWRSRQWKSIQAFKTHQRTWAIVGFCLSPILILPLFVYHFFIFGLSDSSDTNTNSKNEKTEQVVKNNNQSQANSTPTTTDGNVFKTVEIGNLVDYSYENGLFSIKVPEGWTLREKSKSGEVIVQWQDKNQNALINVDIFGSESKLTQAQLIEGLKAAVKQYGQSEKDFNMGNPTTLDSGKIRITWSYSFESGGQKGVITGNSFIEQVGNKVSVFTDAVPQEQFDRLKGSLEEIFSSYKINSSASLP